MTTQAQVLLVIFGAMWVAGWVWFLKHTSFQEGTRWYQKFFGSVASFFIWPFIAWGMDTGR